jgi:hypothetical protein
MPTSFGGAVEVWRWRATGIEEAGAVGAKGLAR